MQTPSQGITKTLHIIGLPVKLASHALHRIVPHNKNVSRFLISVLVMLTGAFMASIEQHIVPHFMWDAFAYFIHGVGGAPIAEAILKAASLD